MKGSEMYVRAPSFEVPRSTVLFAALTYGVIALAALIRPVLAPPSEQGPKPHWPGESP